MKLNDVQTSTSFFQIQAIQKKKKKKRKEIKIMIA